MTVAFECLPIGMIKPSENNPRKHFDPVAMAELVESIKQHGIMVPIIVRPRQPKGWELVAGERRYRAAREAGLAELPAVVRELTDVEALELTTLENLQREDLHPLEEAEGFERLLAIGELQYKSVEALAAKLGKSKSHVYQRMKLLSLSRKSREAFFEDKLDLQRALLVARIVGHDRQDEAVKVIVKGYGDGTMSYRQAADYVHRTFMLRLDQAPFKTADASLVPAAGACTVCPKRSGNHADLFGETTKGAPDLCTDPECYESKRQAYLDRRRAEAEAKGSTLITGAEAKRILPYSYSEAAAGYVKLDDICYEAPGRQTYRQVAGGKRAITPTLVEDPHSGKIIEVAQRSDVALLAKERGIEITSSRATGGENAKTKAKYERINAYRRALFTAVHAAAQAAEGFSDMTLIAQQMHRGLAHDNVMQLAKVRGWPAERDASAEIAKLEDGDLHLLMMQMATIHEIRVPEYYLDIAKPELLLALADQLKVDAAAIQKEVDAEHRAKQRAKDQRAKARADAEASKAKPAPKKKGAPKKAKVAPPAQTASEDWPFPVGAV